MAKKKVKVSTLKAKLDKTFSEYIRRREARILHQRTGTDISYAECCSCGKVDLWRDMDAGHFVDRGDNATRYAEDNVHAQCRRCNRFKGGRMAGYAEFMMEVYGLETIKELNQRSRQVKQFKTSELQELIELYKAKIKELQNDR